MVKKKTIGHYIGTFDGVSVCFRQTINGDGKPYGTGYFQFMEKGKYNKTERAVSKVIGIIDDVVITWGQRINRFGDCLGLGYFWFKQSYLNYYPYNEFLEDVLFDFLDGLGKAKFYKKDIKSFLEHLKDHGIDIKQLDRIERMLVKFRKCIFGECSSSRVASTL